jgi:hypothetical protein
MSGSIIKSVDGKDVAGQEARAFELLPGCHVVQTTNNLMMASNYVEWRGGIAPRTFALKMKPGRTYVVRLSLVEGMYSARVSIRAEEQDAGGATTATFDPAKNVDEIKACLRWHSDEIAPP